ncbi:DUF3035 domain-containing protein [Roseomonas sp. NAR14]|uniref:DUF3035 domain-containing protein n=1 Tax=Roseomonas acroporae TaxID=2937791 RepID=A0A9X2BTX9_9PROT|nr:DUF3035 domain-containing protein [Roseomonas acroporae]MCK8785113.1 DUF3035 domain-containing protein [Roseomonas acroporae]
MIPRAPATIFAKVPIGAALGVALGLLAGCGPETQRAFGFTRDAPDEFQVTTRAPLSMPPDLNNLPVPRPGAARPQEMTQREAAEAALVPSTALAGRTNARPDAAEQALVAQAGAAAPRDIRRRVDEESLSLDRPPQDVVDRLMFWREPPTPGTPVDPTREASRLRENAALGREVTEGDTPVIQRTRRPIFDFGWLNPF